MTTTVTVKAHCAKEKEVVISIGGAQLSEVKINDGQEWSDVVYDEKTISVREQLKEVKEQDKIDFGN